MSNDLQESPASLQLQQRFSSQAEMDLKELGHAIVNSMAEEFEDCSPNGLDDVLDVINQAIKKHRHNVPMTVPFPLLEKPEKKEFTLNLRYEITVEAWNEDEAELLGRELDGTISIGENYCDATDYYDLSVEEA